MKRLLRIVARLYPAAWRKRYGDEFDILLEDARPGLTGALDILKGALVMQLFSWTPLRVLAVSVTAGVLFHIVLIHYMIPPWWSSAAVIQVKSSPSTAAESVQALLSESVLSQTIQSQGLYEGESDALDHLRSDIRVTRVADGVRLQFAHSDPKRAQLVTQALATRLAEAEPDDVQLVEAAGAPEIHSATFARKTTVGGAGIGLATGTPIALLLYWRRRKRP